MKPNASDSQGDAQEFLDDIFERAVRQIEEGRPAIVDELLDGRENLRADVERLIRLASQIASGPICRMPVIGGYDVLHEIGQGGMGTVYLARQESLGGRPVALKVLPVNASLSPRARDRFTFEARAIARLRHPNIVAIHDVLDEDGLCAYAMEWIDGTSLAAWIEERKNGSKFESCVPLDVAGICRLGISIARALAAVHNSGILHRDVKPSNILLRRDGTALLADFGLAREVDSSIHTQDGRFAGTVAYAPPEQLRGDTARVDARSDVYALGVTLYHALALRLPFEAREPVAMLSQIETGLSTPLRKLNPRVPRDLETIITKAIDPDPARRYQTALEFAEDLERLLSFQPIHARRAGLATRSVKLLRRNRAAAIGLTIGSLLTVLIATGLVTYFFFVPGWVAGHVRNARLALLDPGQATNIVSTLYWGRINPYSADHWAERRRVFDQALAGYDAALRWAPYNDEIRRERAVIQRARDDAGTLPASSPFSDQRSAGLYAFLTSDYKAAMEQWAQWETVRDPLAQPDPLVDAAMGVLFLFDELASRAYPRLQKAVESFPGVGFLLEYLADAAIKCGDVERAERWLQEAQHLRTSAGGGANNRIRAAILARQGRDDEAEAIYRSVTTPGPVILEHARFLESRGRMEEAMVQYSRAAQFMPGSRLNRIFVDAADRWWSGLTARQRLKKIRAALDDPFGTTGSLAPLLRQYQTSKALLSSSTHSTPPSLSRFVAQSLAFPPPSLRRFVASSLFTTLAESISSPSLQSLSLSELAERMEVEDMSLWNRTTSLPSFVKQLRLAGWRSPEIRPAASILDFVFSRSRDAATAFRNRKLRDRTFVLATLALGFATSQPVNGQCTTPPCFQGLGDLPGGATSSIGYALSSDGSTVVGVSSSANGSEEAFRWRGATGIVGLGDLPGDQFLSYAIGTNFDGSRVMGASWTSTSNGPQPRRAFLWTEAEGMLPLADLDGPAGGVYSTEAGMSDDGMIFGASWGLAGYVPVRWPDVNTVLPLSVSFPNPSAPDCVSRNGQWAAGTNGSLNTYFLWSEQTGILNFGPRDSWPSAVSDTGIVVFTQYGSGWLWSLATGMISLPDLPGGSTQSAALGINAGGDIVLGRANSAFGDEAVIWKNPGQGITRVVDVLTAAGVVVPNGWSLTAANELTVNANVVTICGNGTNPQGNPEAWIARYTLPTPCTTPPCFHGLGDLPGGANFSAAYGLSGDGLTVVGSSSSTSAPNAEAFRWRADTGMVALGDLAGAAYESQGFGVSGDGSVVVGWSRSGPSCGTEAYRWTEQTGMVGLGFAQGCDSYADGISNDATIIAGGTTSVMTYFSGGTWTSVTGMSGGYQISRNGQWITGPAQSQAARWSLGTGVEILGDLPGGSLSAFGQAAGDNGTIVGLGSSGNGPEAFRWTPGSGMVGLGDLSGGAFDSYALGISADSSLIIGYGTSALGAEAVLWDQSLTIHRLADVLAGNGVTIPSGWTLQYAYEIVINGSVVSICGSGTNPQGNTEAWIARYAIPCPAHTGDMNADTFADGRDVQRFAQAIVAASTAFANTCPGDFNDSGMVDPPDVPGFVSVLLAP